MLCTCPSFIRHPINVESGEKEGGAVRWKREVMSEVKREMALTRDVASKSGYKWLKLSFRKQRLNATEEKTTWIWGIQGTVG